MIESIRIQNFKCFDDELIPLKPLTVLSGINGMGKSSFMQSLLLLRQSVLEAPDTMDARLNGPLVSLGYADDVFYENAPRNANISFAIKESTEQQHGQEDEQWFAFDYATGQQTLKWAYKDDPPLFHGSLFADNFYYLKAERIGPRTSFDWNQCDGSQLNPIGNAGEYCAWLLAQNEREPIDVESLMHESEPLNELRAQVEAWLSEIGQNPRIHLNQHHAMDRVSMQFSFMRENIPSSNYRPTNVGFGLTYTLPIFVAALLAKPGGLLCIENPEAHLHPRAQSAMGKFLARVAAAGVQVVVETHSDHLLNGVRIAAKQGLVDPAEVALHYFHRKPGTQSTTVVTPQMDRNGRLDQWPDGFFDEWENGLAELL